MIRRFLEVWFALGMFVVDKYTNVTERWIALALLPIYTVFVIPYELVLVLGLFAFAVQCKIDGSLTFTESFNALKEGINEGLEELKG